MKFLEASRALPWRGEWYVCHVHNSELALVTALVRNAFCMVHKAYNRISLRGNSTAVAEEEETRNVGGRYRVSSHLDLGGWVRAS